MDSITRLRRRIDATDAELVRLLVERMRLAGEIGREKDRNGLPVWDAGRERAVLARVLKLGGRELSAETLEPIWREIFSASRTLQQPASTAYLGPEATFSHLAARRHFGQAEPLVPQESIADVFRAVESGECRRGVVPVENSTEGSVTPTLDLLVETPLTVIDEIYLEVHHALLSLEKSPATVSTVYSHPQALSQCREWLRSHLPGARLVEVPSTAEAARMAAREPRSGAVAGELAARLYGLPVLKRRIEDFFDNLTRFLVLGTAEHRPTGRDKTSLIITLRDRPGALNRLLAPLAEASINLTRIESRPSRRRAWDYLFFLDLEGHREEHRVSEVLEGFREECPYFRVLGSYPNRRPAPGEAAARQTMARKTTTRKARKNTTATGGTA